jgi:hypothetical protein
MNIDGRERNFQIDEAYLLWVKPDTTIKDLFRIRRIQLYIIQINQTAARFMKLRFGEEKPICAWVTMLWL